MKTNLSLSLYKEVVGRKKERVPSHKRLLRMAMRGRGIQYRVYQLTGEKLSGSCTCSVPNNYSFADKNDGVGITLDSDGHAIICRCPLTRNPNDGLGFDFGHLSFENRKKIRTYFGLPNSQTHIYINW